MGQLQDHQPAWHQGTDTMATRAGIVPPRTSDPAEVAALFREHGAAILTGCGTSWDDALQLPREAFPNTRSLLPPVKLCLGNGVVTEAAARKDGGAHSDGYAYGDSVNDAFLLLCCRPCGRGGGQSFLVDAAAVMAGLQVRDPALAHKMLTEPINQTSTCTCVECVPDGVPLESVSPLVRSTGPPPAGSLFGG
eukprot:SAG22_NODE_3477_length_1688_cov_2.665198_1_plen_192_part_10